MLKWPTPVYVYDLEKQRFLREFENTRLAIRYMLANTEVELGLVFYKLDNIKKLLPKAWVFSNQTEIEFPLVKVDVWLEKTIRSKKQVEALPVGLLEYIVLEAKRAYYNTPEPIMTDSQFDRLEALLKKKNKLSRALAVGAEIDETLEEKQVSVGPEKVELPYYMGSMNKLKSNVEKFKYPGPYCVTDKMDGISLMYANDGKNSRLYTRGNGSVGQDVSHLLSLLNLPKLKSRQAVRGELIFSKSAFKKYEKQFKNARNMMAGITNRKSISNEIKTADFVVFKQVFPVKSQSSALADLKTQGFKVVWNNTLKKLSTTELENILKERKANSPYEIDGLVIEDDNKHPVDSSGNPDYAFAFKSNSAFTSVQVQVLEVEWNISRHGQIKPTVILQPVQLDGVTVSRATAHNAKYVYDNKIGPGAILEIVRSGGVIPYIENVIKPARKPQMPKGSWTWDKTGVNVIEKTGTAKNQLVTQLSFALRQLGIENIGVGQASMLYDMGFETIADVLNADMEDYESLGPKRAQELYNAIVDIYENPDPVNLMVASGVFGMGMGELKIGALLKQYPNFATLTLKKALLLETPKGFSNSTFESICNSLPDFHAWLKEVGISKNDLVLEQEEVLSNKLKGKTFLFTGFRDKNLEEKIKQNGGEVSNTFSKKISYVVVKDKSTTSSKAQAAREANISLILPRDIEKMLGK